MFTEQVQQFSQRPHRASHDCIEAAVFQPFLATTLEDFDIQAQFLDHLLNSFRLLADRIADHDGEIWPQDLERNPRNSTPSPQIQDFLTFDQQFGKFIGIQQVSSDKLFGRGMPRQIHLLIP